MKAPEGAFSLFQSCNCRDPGISDLAVAGALRMEQQQAGKMARLLEAKFANNLDGLRTLYTYSGLSENFSVGLEKLLVGLGDADFTKVVWHYMIMRSAEGRSLLRHLTEMDLLPDDFVKISNSIVKGKVSSSTIIEVMAQRIGGGKNGIACMLEISAEIHPKQQGTFFEQWYKTNFTSPALQGGKTVTLADKTTIIMDNSFVENGKNVIGSEELS